MTASSLTLSPQQVSARRRRSLRTALVGWSFILPNFLGFALFTLVPVIACFVIAFTKWDAYNAPTLVGVSNFTRLLNDSNFWIALGNTAYYAIGHIPLTMAVALALALLLNRSLRGIGVFRTAVFFPYLTSLVAVAIVFNLLFAPDNGPINQLLQSIGIADPPRWTASTQWAMPTVIITSVWRDMGYYMILFLAGLQTVPREYYEAAEVDGASAWQRFRFITLPCLRPTTYFVLILVTISSFKVFDLIQVMTEGGPGRATLVLSQLIYRQGIVQGDFGYASAMSLVMFIIVLAFTLLQFKLSERGNK